MTKEEKMKNRKLGNKIRDLLSAYRTFVYAEERGSRGIDIATCQSEILNLFDEYSKRTEIVYKDRIIYKEKIIYRDNVSILRIHRRGPTALQVRLFSFLSKFGLASPVWQLFEV